MKDQNMVSFNSISGGRSSAFMANRFPADYHIFSLVCVNDHNAGYGKFYKQYRSEYNIINDKLQKSCPEYGEFRSTAEHYKTLF